MLRVRFAPSPTGFLHIGSARTFIFNWLYARRNGGVMILRIDDTDVERNTQASLDSIFEGLRCSNWGGMSNTASPNGSPSIRLPHKPSSKEDSPTAISRPPSPTPAMPRAPKALGCLTRGAREISAAESDSRAAAGEPSCSATASPRRARQHPLSRRGLRDQVKSTADIEDFALLRSNGMPTYHLASCADDADLRISHIIRGQDHLTNTFSTC